MHLESLARGDVGDAATVIARHVGNHAQLRVGNLTRRNLEAHHEIAFFGSLLIPADPFEAFHVVFVDGRVTLRRVTIDDIVPHARRGLLDFQSFVAREGRAFVAQFVERGQTTVVGQLVFGATHRFAVDRRLGRGSTLSTRCINCLFFNGHFVILLIVRAGVNLGNRAPCVVQLRVAKRVVARFALRFAHLLKTRFRLQPNAAILQYRRRKIAERTLAV